MRATASARRGARLKRPFKGRKVSPKGESGLKAGRRGSLLSSLFGQVAQTWPAFLVLGAGLLMTHTAWRFFDERAADDAAAEFRQRTVRAVEVVERQVHDNVNLLLGIRGLFVASADVTRKEFRHYLSALRPEQRYPGIRVVSYGAHFPHAERASFERGVRTDATVRPEGIPNFEIKPPGNRDEYVVIEYFEPFQGNEVSLGLDLFAN